LLYFVLRVHDIEQVGTLKEQQLKRTQLENSCWSGFSRGAAAETDAIGCSSVWPCESSAR